MGYLAKMRSIAVILLLVFAVPIDGAHALDCGDVTGSGGITASDALLLLNLAVGQPAPDPVCPQAGGLPRTGQTKCYDLGGVEISCVGTGQDGDTQAGAARSFTNNGDGTITDDATGLMWEVQCQGALCGTLHSHTISYGWGDAFGHVATLNAETFAGHDDWRVPNLNELESLRNAEVGGGVFPAFDECPVGANCDATTCSCTAANYYWSSTTFDDESDPNAAWIVNFFTGGVTAGFKAGNTFAVRAVRTAP